jgi:glycosyltransferase involved in cell wall biosynthesis
VKSEPKLRVLALEPYYGGSHRAFLDGWVERSRHDWTVLSLPPRKWKWRMRHAAVTLAVEAGKRLEKEPPWDVIFCSDMLNLAEFLGLAPPPLRNLPVLAYFHENQLTYPVVHEREWDYHFGITNMTTALAATRVWFNSDFHRHAFLTALRAFLKRMPDHQPLEAVDRIAQKSRVRHPSVSMPPGRPPRRPGPLRILWAARWEYDKNPDLFFAALHVLRAKKMDFRISVLGQRFQNSPSVFAGAKLDFADVIDHWGFLKSRKEYEAALTEVDVYVSTADHEFFGMAAVEAALAGAFPLLPARLAYPEVFDAKNQDFFYSHGAEELADRLARMAAVLTKSGDIWAGDPGRAQRIATAYTWEKTLTGYDDELAGLTDVREESSK